jgi:hypothetical protein
MEYLKLGLGVALTGFSGIVIYAEGNAYAQVLAVPAAFVIGMLVSRVC